MRGGLAAFVLFLFALPCLAAPFVPEQPTIPADALRVGERGYMLTVLKGTKPSKIPVELAGVVPLGGEVRDTILIRLLGGAKLALGMSGSPVYFRGRLAGAVGGGWERSDHALAMVTPIADMCGLFSREKVSPRGRGGSLTSPVAVSGLPSGAAASLARALGVELDEAPVGSRVALPVTPERLNPGEALAVLLAWGDVSVSATGTVTATSKDGRFIAMGHDFLSQGEAGYPAARATVHGLVQSREFPFKLASPLSIAGTITQDRAAGLGGRWGFFGPSIPAVLAFEDMDLGRREERRFRVVPDVFLASKLLGLIYAGLIEDVWGRKGQGTLDVTLRIEGQGIPNGWTRNDVFCDEEDVGPAALKRAVEIMNAVLTQPFQDAMPLGFRLEVRASKALRALLIEDVEVPEEAEAGSDLPVTVTLRPWRGQRLTRRFTLKVPEGASGVWELLVRGGGSQPMGQTAVEGGWKAIDGLDRLLKELGALDANDELILELNGDPVGELIDSLKAEKKRPSLEEDGKLNTAEETEFLSETKARRIKDGTLRVFRAGRLVDGLMKRAVRVRSHAGR